MTTRSQTTSLLDTTRPVGLGPGRDVGDQETFLKIDSLPELHVPVSCPFLALPKDHQAPEQLTYPGFERSRVRHPDWVSGVVA